MPLPPPLSQSKSSRMDTSICVIGSQLMNRRPSSVEDQEEDPAIDELQKALENLSWVEKARVRLREDGDVLTGESFIQPRDGGDLLDRMAEARKSSAALIGGCMTSAWCL